MHLFLGGRLLSTIKTMFLIVRTLSRIKITSFIEVGHFPYLKLLTFLKVEHFPERRGRTFSRVGHKHGHRLYICSFLVQMRTKWKTTSIYKMENMDSKYTYTLYDNMTCAGRAEWNHYT